MRPVWPYIWKFCDLCETHYRIDIYEEHRCLPSIADLEANIE